MIQSSMFTISNVLLSGAVNTLTTEEISAKTIAFSMTELISTAMAAYTHAAVTSTAQNCGARKTDRIKSSLVCCIWQSALIGISMAAVILLLREPLTMLFIDKNDPNMDIVVQYTMEALWTITPTYFLVGTMNSLAGTMRGAGYALVPMIISIVGVCGLRIVWIYTAFRTEALHSLSGLFVAYPITYVITILSLVIAFVIMMKKIGSREPASVK